MPKHINHTSIKYRGAIKCHGGKYYLARHHLALMPPHIDRLVEPYQGGATVSLNAAHADEVILSDTNWLNTNLYRVIQSQCDDLVDTLKRVNYDLQTWRAAHYQYIHQYKMGTGVHPTLPGGMLTAAVDYMVVNRMSRGGMCKAFGWSERLRGGQPGDLNAWMTMLDELPLIAKRLQHVRICTQPSLTTIQQCDSPGTFFYCDPPYYKPTRTAPKAYGPHECSRTHHEQMATLLKTCWGHVMVCGYMSTLYQDLFAGWRTWVKDMPNHSGQGSGEKNRRQEYVWMNYHEDFSLIHPTNTPTEVLTHAN
jgi:DNA adenine methylase